MLGALIVMLMVIMMVCVWFEHRTVGAILNTDIHALQVSYDRYGKKASVLWMRSNNRRKLAWINEGSKERIK